MTSIFTINPREGKYSLFERGRSVPVRGSDGAESGGKESEVDI